MVKMEFDSFAIMLFSFFNYDSCTLEIQCNTIYTERKSRSFI
jgi:hypothetical protein